MRVQTFFEYQPLLFDRPVEVIRCDELSRLKEAFEALERLLKEGCYLAGFLSYEAGMAFEPKQAVFHQASFPLLIMGAYRKPPAKIPLPGRRGERGTFALKDIQLNISREAYGRDIDAIRDLIALGEVYQITYCLKLKFGFSGEPQQLFEHLFRAQPVPYGAYLDAGDFQVLSLSPERFFKKTGKRVLTEPMKGTWMRGAGPFEDVLARFRFSKDKKNRAENVMIADLLRNDLGRVAKNIRAPKLFTITPYQTLFQMTSTVTGEVSRGIPLWDLFSALFPSGSVTGAPRLRAMEVIRSLEKEERKIYTGAIGYITPDRDMYFNIPIRTALLRDGDGEMGIGGGIVWDSTADGEWAEGLLKASFLTTTFVQKVKEDGYFNLPTMV